MKGGNELDASVHDPAKAVPVTFKDVRYTVKIKKAEKVILDGISGVMPAGRMTALSDWPPFEPR